MAAEATTEADDAVAREVATYRAPDPALGRVLRCGRRGAPRRGLAQHAAPRPVPHLPGPGPWRPGGRRRRQRAGGPHLQPHGAGARQRPSRGGDRGHAPAPGRHLLLGAGARAGGGGRAAGGPGARTRAGALLCLRDRGHPPRRAGRPGVHRAAAHRQGRRRLPRQPGRRLREHPPPPRPSRPRRAPAGGPPGRRPRAGGAHRHDRLPVQRRRGRHGPTPAKWGTNWPPCSSSR